MAIEQLWRVKIPIDWNLTQSVDRALDASNNSGRAYVFKFNGIDIHVYPGSIGEEVQQKYLSELEESRSRRAGGTAEADPFLTAQPIFTVVSEGQSSHE